MQMQSFDQHLLDLYHANNITLETACDAASNPADFNTQLALEGDSVREEEGDDTGSSVELEQEGRF